MRRAGKPEQLMCLGIQILYNVPSRIPREACERARVDWRVSRSGKREQRGRTKIGNRAPKRVGSASSEGSRDANRTWLRKCQSPGG